MDVVLLEDVDLSPGMVGGDLEYFSDINKRALGLHKGLFMGLLDQFSNPV